MGGDSSSGGAGDERVCPVDHSTISKDHPFWKNHPHVGGAGAAATAAAPSLAAPPAAAAFKPHGASAEDESSCPYRPEAGADGPGASLTPLNNMPPPNQQPAAGQKMPLATEREVSSIPMGGQHSGANWIYPSEQMFFNAMRRKNWDANEEDMRVIVPIHNAVNEQCWKKILEWEALHAKSCAQPKLLKFQGRPREYTPKARLLNLLGYKLPFDRHDWTVDRCGTQVTYVIDFYSGATKSPTDVSFYLDVRPAISFQGLKDRFNKFWKTGSGLW
ncbi:Cytochrome c1 heme lyase [Polyrhizophydium stewartii]|uniref:Holocytochrome c-type synthase n=1 Tax=Polyrhizophydium stewartii TaxID=2732419 RepID=A0ABR4N1D9_9FUNG